MSNFNQATPTTMTKVIPSYLYQQYQDDPTLPAFILAYNEIAQEYINTLNDLNLPIYTQSIISGGLLDWVGAGLYGLPRPSISSYQQTIIGPYNTYEYNNQPMYGTIKYLYLGNIIQTTDDIYKRILTWHFLKGDGKYFNVRWLKRRIMRFLVGTDGANPNIDQTYQISVTFGSQQTITIRFIDYTITVQKSVMYNQFQYNSLRFNYSIFTKTNLTPLPNQAIFAAAVKSAALELPFQFTWNVGTKISGGGSNPSNYLTLFQLSVLLGIPLTLNGNWIMGSGGLPTTVPSHGDVPWSNGGFLNLSPGGYSPPFSPTWVNYIPTTPAPPGYVWSNGGFLEVS